MNFFDLIDKIPEIGFTLLTPGVNLDKEVEGVDVSETPDIHEYIAPKTLLLTTAMVYGSGERGLVELIEKLHQAGVSGLAVKLGRFIFDMDPAALAKAEELDFPVFRIAPDTTLGIAAHKLQAEIMGAETKQLYYALEIQKKISGLVYQNSSLEELLRYFSKLLNRPILYFDFFFDLRGQGATYNTPLKLTQEEISNIGSSLRAIHVQHPINSIDEFILPGAEGEIHCLVVPVRAGREFPHFLAIMYEGKMPELFSYFVAESASNVFAFAAHNTRQLLAKDWEFRQEAFTRLLQRKDPLTTTDFRLLSPTYTYTGPGPWQLVAVGFTARPAVGEMEGLDVFALVHDWIKKKLAPMEQTSIMVPLPSEGCFVLVLREPAVLLRSLLRSIADGLRRYHAISLKFGVANQLPDPDSLRFGHIQASLALREALEDERGKENINFYHSKGIQELFHFVPPEHIRHFCLHTLKELAYPESEYDRELRQTLESYLNYQSDISQTAKLLGIHRNTVKYRIEKTRHILGLSPGNTGQSLEIRLAILMSKMDV